MANSRRKVIKKVVSMSKEEKKLEIRLAKAKKEAIELKKSFQAKLKSAEASSFANGYAQAVKKNVTAVEYIDEDKICVIYNGFDAVEDEYKDCTLESRLDCLDESVIRFAIVANIRPIKHIDDAIKAFSIVNQRIPNCVLIIIGAGDSEPLQELAKQLSIFDKDIFFGPVKNVKFYLSFIDIGLLCSQTEGLSNAIIEYLNAEIPVMSAPVISR